MAVLSTCNKHNETVVCYLFSTECPLCQALETIQKIESENECLKRDIYLLEAGAEAYKEELYNIQESQ